MTSSIRVLICDDHALLRSGLRLLLEAEADIAVVGEAANAEEAIERVARARARRRAARHRHARAQRRRCAARPARRGAADEGADALDAGRPDLRPHRRSRPARPATSSRRPPTPSSSRPCARSPPDGASSIRRSARGSPQPSRGASAGTRAALGARARSAAAARARPHEPGDREAAVDLRAHRRDPSRAPRAQARAQDQGRDRALRARDGAARSAPQQRRDRPAATARAPTDPRARMTRCAVDAVLQGSEDAAALAGRALGLAAWARRRLCDDACPDRRRPRDRPCGPAPARRRRGRPRDGRRGRRRARGDLRGALVEARRDPDGRAHARRRAGSRRSRRCSTSIPT